MKKFLIFMMLAFSVVMYASPPPVPDFITEQIQFAPPGETVQNVAEYIYVSNSVAFVDIGNSELQTCFAEFGEVINNVIVPRATVTELNYIRLSELKKPPAKPESAVAPNFKVNKQNSNYGYPLTGDKQALMW